MDNKHIEKFAMSGDSVYSSVSRALASVSMSCLLDLAIYARSINLISTIDYETDAANVRGNLM